MKFGVIIIDLSWIRYNTTMFYNHGSRLDLFHWSDLVLGMWEEI